MLKKIIAYIKKHLNRIHNILLNSTPLERIAVGLLLFFLYDSVDTTIQKIKYSKSYDVIHYHKLAKEMNKNDSNSTYIKLPISELINKVVSEKDHIDGNNSNVFFLLQDSGVGIIFENNETNKTFLTGVIPSFRSSSIAEKKFIDNNVSYSWLTLKEPPSGLIDFVFSFAFLNLVFLGGLLYYLFSMTGFNPLSNEFKAINPEDIEGSFDDLIGYEDIKKESLQLLDIISHNEKYREYGIDGTFNILFSGKPGTGKSKFALYLAKEIGVPIISTTGSLDEVYVGSGAKKIREMFKEAQKAAKRNKYKTAIIFIDEAQKLLSARNPSSDKKWEDDTANELLAYINGVKTVDNVNIIIIMASNFDETNMDSIDDAMMRRFRKKIYFRPPNMEERKKIIQHYLSDISAKKEKIDITPLANITSGLTPALIEGIIEESALLALRESTLVDEKILLKAFELTMMGESDRKTTEEQEKIRNVVSVHEVGHFIVDLHRNLIESSWDLSIAKEKSTIVKISSESLSRIGALGYVLHKGGDDSELLQTVEDMEWDIMSLYGGLAAEEVLFGKNRVTTGSHNDIQKISKILHYLIFHNGVYSDFHLDYSIINNRNYKIKLIEQKSSELYSKSFKIVKAYSTIISILATHLLKEWTLSKEQIFKILNSSDMLEEIDKIKNTIK